MADEHEFMNQKSPLANVLKVHDLFQVLIPFFYIIIVVLFVNCWN